MLIKKNYIRVVITSLHTVYTQKRYFLLTILIAFFTYAGNVLFHNFKLVLGTSSLSLTLALLFAPQAMYTSFSIILLILISVLAGIVFSMSTFLLRRQFKVAVSAGSTSVLMSILAPACPACALGVFGLIGVNGFLAALPFGGIEFGILGLVILIGSTMYLSTKIQTNICELKPKKKD